MRKIIWLAILAAVGLTCGVAFAQGPVTGYCTLGSTPAVVSGLNSTNRLQGVIPKCTVTVRLTGTVTLATLFSDSSGTPLGNPFTANMTTGQWLFYASTASLYDVVLSGGTAPNTYPLPVTLTGLQAGGVGGGGGAVASVTGQAPIVVTPTTGATVVSLGGCITAVTFSSTPVIAMDGCAKSLTLTGNVSSATMSGVIAGKTYVVLLIQDATGSRTFTWPTTIHTTSPINAAANGKTTCYFTAYPDLNLYPNGACTWN